MRVSEGPRVNASARGCVTGPNTGGRRYLPVHEHQPVAGDGDPPTPAEVARKVDGLARAARAGDRAALEALVRAIYRRVYRWAVVAVGDPDDAEDVTQRVLTGLLSKLGGWREGGRFTSWLYRITANEAHSWRRRARSALKRSGRAWTLRAETHVDPSEPEEVDRRRLVEHVRRLFGRLPQRQREVMDLVDFQGYTPTEAAEMLAMNPSTVRVTLHKARRALREGLLRDDPLARERLGR